MVQNVMVKLPDLVLADRPEHPPCLDVPYSGADQQAEDGDDHARELTQPFGSSCDWAMVSENGFAGECNPPGLIHCQA